MRHIPIEHPGIMLKEDYLDDLGIKPGTLARHIGVDNSAIQEIIKGRRKITAEMSLKLGLFFDISKGFWYRLQTDYDLRIAKRDKLEKLEEAITPYEEVA